MLLARYMKNREKMGITTRTKGYTREEVSGNPVLPSMLVAGTVTDERM